MQLAQQLHAAGLAVFPCRSDKAPAVPRGSSWADPANQYPQAQQWPSGLVGLPIPAGVVVLDLDTYKGTTCQTVDALLGCSLPWAQALIQTTQRGGQHYAFAVDWPVKQGSNIGVTGFDTRVAGKGYIATGDGYTHAGFGPYALAHPSALPRLPDAARAVLEHVEREVQAAELPQGDRDTDAVLSALAVVPADCGRSEWVRIGLALRHHYHDDEATGFEIFRRWSAGELHGGDVPGNYDGDTIEGQFLSFKPDGATAIGTLFYEAMQRGWSPPAQVDVAAAFGGLAASDDVFGEMVDRIQAEGGNPKSTTELIGAIAGQQFSQLQLATLLATLNRELKDAGLLTRAVRDQLDTLAGSTRAPKPQGPAAALADVVPLSQLPARPLAAPTTSHGCNASAMLKEVFGQRLAVLNGQLRWWSGREWEAVDGDTLETLGFIALRPDKSTLSNVQGTARALYALAPRLLDNPNDRRVYFRNGVLDLGTGQLHAHDMHNANTGTLTVDYDPFAQAPLWDAFLQSIFGGTDDGMDRAALLQEIMGWCMFRDNLNAQKAVAFDGASRGGKGVILDLLSALLGPGGAGAFTFAGLASGKTQSAFRHYPVMIDSEAKPPARQTIPEATAFLNKVASNETVSVELLHKQQPWTGRLNTKMLIGCNGVPTMIDDSGASANRFMVLKFTRSFADSEDRGLYGRLAHELPGIAAWAVAGAQRLLSRGGRFTMPETSLQATSDLRDSNQPLREFLNDCAAYGPDLRCHSSDIWKAYQEWAVGCNVRLPSRNSFYKSLHQTLLGTSCERSAAVRIGEKVNTGYIGLEVLPLATRALSPGLQVVKGGKA